MSVRSHILLSRFRSAQSVLAVVGVDIVAPNAFALDYKVLAGVAASGVVLPLAKALGQARRPNCTVHERRLVRRWRRQRF
jgi:hypothetical protein